MATVRQYQIIEEFRRSAFSVLTLRKPRAINDEKKAPSIPLNRAQKGKADFLVYVILFVFAIIATFYLR